MMNIDRSNWLPKPARVCGQRECDCYVRIMVIIMLYSLVALFVVSLLCYLYLLLYFAIGEGVAAYDFTSPEGIKFNLLLIVCLVDFGMFLNFIRYVIR